MAISKFYRGSAVFKCDVCGRGTRRTGAQSNTALCPQCYELAGIENEISDGHCTTQERADVIAELVAEVREKGGDVSSWHETFARLAVRDAESERG